MGPKDPFSWSSDQVRTQICGAESDLRSSLQVKPILNLQTLEAALKDNDIDGENLLILDDVNVKEDLGIASFGQRREIRKIIQHLRSISALYQAEIKKAQKRPFSSPDEEQDTTPESKRRRIQSQNPLSAPVPQVTSLLGSNHTSSPHLSSNTPTLPTQPERRRIQPQNLSTEPLTASATSFMHAQFETPIKSSTTVITKPEDFGADALSDQWQEFLSRYPDEPDEYTLRPYNESDVEKELDSEDDASLMAELQSEDDSGTPHLSTEDIQGAIAETVKEFKESWILHKQAKKQKVAYRRWIQAAKAGTRKPQQNALQRELDALQSRFAKFRQSIQDVSRDYHKVSEVKRNCLNLQATVEDIAEKEYYLEALASDLPPAIIQQDLQPPTPHEELSDGEEILESSDSPSEEDQEESDSVSEMSLVSDGESSLGLSFSLSDPEWNPVLPSTKATDPDQPSQQTAIATNGTTTAAEPIEVTDLTLPILPSETPNVVSSAVRPALASPASRLPTMVRKIEAPILTPYTPIPALDHSENDDSDLDRLPRNRYVNEGNTRDTAITLGSSPSRYSDDQTHLSDSSIKTPPLNPTLEAKMRREQPKDMTFPPIKELRDKKWSNIKGDAELALCKIVYHTDRDLARTLLQYIEPLTSSMFVARLRAGLIDIQDTDVNQAPVEDSDPEPDVLLSVYFLTYVYKRHIKDVWAVSDTKLENGIDMIVYKGSPFNKLLRPLLKFYIESGTTAMNRSSLTGLASDMSFTNSGNNLTPTPGTQKGKQNAGSSRFSTPPPRITLTDTETDLDEEPSSLKKRKRHVEQSQQALSQQRDDQSRVQEQERRRQMMMDKLLSQEAAGEDRHVIINSVEEVPILLDQHIARKIKPHQETGVQFIWRELVEDNKQQGCLLAHTMGLGKTMQVISFLVTLAQCNASDRPEVRALIPHRLRSGRVLILCPASLVDNWYDELTIWTPPAFALSSDRGLLGNVYKISGSRNVKIKTVKAWQRRTPAVLIIGYESLRSLLTGKGVPDEDKRYLENALLQDPCIVVGDEAHKMKNAKSSISKLAQTFKTNSRIALTGSPLNNHLEEYHTMIDWIAPGYLGTLVQFKDKYSEPIERGLFAESTRYEKRKSLERLYVLKRDLAPKIDRRDISAIADDMPQKTEFFITVPLTDLQKDLYDLLIRQILSGLNSGSTPRKSSNAQLWSWLSILSWLCNHPTILTQKLENQDRSSVQTGIDDEDLDDDGAPANVDIDKYPIASLLPEFLQQYAKYDEAVDRYSPKLSTRALVTQLLIQESVNRGERILLFSHSIPTLNYLQDMLDSLQIKYMRIDGSTRTDQRQAATKEFNDDNNDYMVFLISTRAGGLGLNLQGANRVIIYDFGFNPSWEEQAIGRAYRLGQKKPVYVYRFRAGGSFEDAMYNKSIFKTQLFSRVVDQKNVIRHTSKNIKDYLFEPREVEQKDLTECLGKDELLDKVVAQTPGAIRELILTETFQREDEDDVLTAEEKRVADAEVEMERLHRTNPDAWAAKQAETKRAAVMQPMPLQTSSQFPTQIDANEVSRWFRDPKLRPEDMVERDSAKANEEKMEISTPMKEIGDAFELTSEGSDEQSNAPGCEQQ